MILIAYLRKYAAYLGCWLGHKTLYAIANEKLLFCDVTKSFTSISQNYQF